MVNNVGKYTILWNLLFVADENMKFIWTAFKRDCHETNVPQNQKTTKKLLFGYNHFKLKQTCI